MVTELRWSVPPVLLLTEAVLSACQPCYHDLAPWQYVAQLPVAAFQALRATFMVPFLCVAAFTDVLL